MNNLDYVLSGMNILIIDDEPAARGVLRRLLTLCRANVIVTATAAEGLEQVTTRKLDVIVSDIDMPKMDGYQFIGEVRNLPAKNGGQTPAVALTAFAHEEDRTRAINAGFQKYLSKPVDFQELIDTIASVAER